jgi:hypothetical protein
MSIMNFIKSDGSSADLMVAVNQEAVPEVSLSLVAVAGFSEALRKKASEELGDDPIEILNDTCWGEDIKDLSIEEKADFIRFSI